MTLRTPHCQRTAGTAILAGAALALAGCTVGPDYTPPSSASLGVPAQYGRQGTPAGAIDLAQWWTQFRDPLLTDLVARATAGNLDIQVSEARLRQAREALIQSRSAALPTITATAGETHSTTYARLAPPGSASRTVATATDTLSLAGDASWQADLFGGTRRSIQASRANAQSAAFQLIAVRTSVAGEVATNYVAVRLAQARLQIARDTLATQDDDLRIAGWRVQAGLASSLDAEQARAQRAQTAAAIPLIEASFTSAATQLGILTGQAPNALVAELEKAGPIPQGPSGIDVGVPADTLRQRPDVRAAERDLAAASAQIGVAEAQLYPALSIGGTLSSAGSKVTGLTDLVTGSLFAGLTQTLFDGGRLRSSVRSARDNADAALATYKKTVLAGLSDVENGLQAFDTAKQRQVALAEANDASRNAALLARNQYRTGITDFVTLLQSEQALLSARDSLAVAQADQANALIALYLAMGGGWSPTEATRLQGQPA